MFRCVCLLLCVSALLPLLSQDVKLFGFPEHLESMRLDAMDSNDWSALISKAEPAGGIAYPGENVQLEVTLHNAGKEALTVTPTIEAVRIHMRFEKYDPSRGDPMISGFQVSLLPVNVPVRTPMAGVTIAPGESTTLAWSPPKGACSEFGVYTLIVELPGKGRQPAGTFGRAHPSNPAGGDGKASPLFYHQHWAWPIETQMTLVSRLGYKWVRTDGAPNWSMVATRNMDGGPDGPFDWTRADDMMDVFRRHGLWVQSNMYGSPQNATTEENWKAFNVVHLPKYDQAWGLFVEEAVRRYCGKDGDGPLQIIDYYNEPWEGGGISGWKSDSARYRAIYKIIYDRAHKASPHIQVGGTSSIMNTVDKFFTVKDWQKQYQFDVLTDHYVQPYSSYGPRLAKNLGIPSIETETWIGNTPDNLIATATHFLAAGQMKVNTNHPVQLFWQKGKSVLMPSPPVMAANQFLSATAGKEFKQIVFHDHLPWLYEWSDTKTSLFILAGDRHAINPAATTMYDQIRANGSISIDSLKGKLKAFDIYGNPYAETKGRYTVPCSYTSVYLSAPGLPAQAVIDAVRAGRIEGVTPVEIFADDFVTPLEQAKTVDVDVHNVLNRAINGTLVVTPPDSITLAGNRTLLALQAGETKTVSVPIVNVKVNPANAYQFTYQFESNDGKAVLTEVLHANVVQYGHPTIDGNLDDWAQVPPVIAFGQSLQREMTERAWKPWEEEREVTKGLAELRLQWDEQYLYIAVRERNKDWAARPRLSTRDDNSYFGKDDMSHTYIKGIYEALPYSGHGVQVGIGLGLHQAGLGAMPEVPVRMIADDDVDYEYAFWGAPDGGELWRSSKPGMQLFNFLPRCMPQGYDGVPKNARVVVTRDGDDTCYEVAIPLADMPELQPAPGKVIKFTFALPASGIKFGLGRSRTRSNGLTLKPTWEGHPSCEIRWGFVQ